MRAFLLRDNDGVSAIYAEDIVEALRQLNEQYPMEIPSEYETLCKITGVTPKGFLRYEFELDGLVATWRQKLWMQIGHYASRVTYTDVSLAAVIPYAPVDNDDALLYTLTDIEEQIQFCLALDKTELASECLAEEEDVENRLYLADKYDLPATDADEAYAAREHDAYVAGMPVHVGW